MDDSIFKDLKGVIVYYPDSADLVILETLSDLPIKIGASKVNKATRIEVLPFNVLL